MGNTIQHYPAIGLPDTRQVHAIELLAQDMTKANVAKELGINRSTVYEWLSQPLFTQALRRRKVQIRAIIEDSSPYVAGLMHWQEHLPQVMRSVVEVACDPAHKNQLRAAELILEHLRPEHLDQSVSEDARVVADYAQNHGWHDGTA